MAKVAVIFRVEEEEIRWFEEKFPMYGAKQWFFSACLAKLRNLHDDKKIEAPVDLLDLIVKEVGDL